MYFGFNYLPIREPPWNQAKPVFVSLPSYLSEITSVPSSRLLRLSFAILTRDGPGINQIHHFHYRFLPDHAVLHAFIFLTLRTHGMESRTIAYKPNNYTLSSILAALLCFYLYRCSLTVNYCILYIH